MSVKIEGWDFGWWYLCDRMVLLGNLLLGFSTKLYCLLRWFCCTLAFFAMHYHVSSYASCVELVVIVFKFSTCELFDMDNNVYYDM